MNFLCVKMIYNTVFCEMFVVFCTKFVYFCIYDLFHILLFLWHTNGYMEYRCVCVCVCARARARVYVCVYIYIYVRKNMKMATVYYYYYYYYYRGADKSLARPASWCILFDGENISFDASLVLFIYIYIPPIMITNRIYEHQNLLSL